MVDPLMTLLFLKIINYINFCELFVMHIFSMSHLHKQVDCRVLKCRNSNNDCVSYSSPLVDGTECGNRKVWL